MLKIYNKNALTQKERFVQAIIFGTLATIGLIICYVLFNRIIGDWEFQVAFIAVGYAIGYVVKKTGRGVQLKFSILAAILCTFVIAFGDLFTYFPEIITYPNLWFDGFRIILHVYSQLDFNAIIGLLFRATGIYIAYINGRII